MIPKTITKQQAGLVYVNEADLLNVALFGITVKEWQENNPNQKGNIRDEATLEQLVVLSNLEIINIKCAVDAARFITNRMTDTTE